MLKKGLVLTNAILDAETDAALFASALDILADSALEVIEYFAPPEQAVSFAAQIRERGMQAQYISAVYQKRNGCRLCDENEEKREASVAFTKTQIDVAKAAGSPRTIIQSGRYPDDPAKEGLCLDALRRSLEELSRYAGKDLLLSLEPCDRSVDICQLIGPSLEACQLMRACRFPADNICLTMDMAHSTELFELPFEALALCRPFCNHVHIANCVLQYGDPLFGDKHPFFGVAGGSWDSEDAQRFYRDVEALYGEEECCVSMEMIGRNEADPLAYLRRLMQAEKWFFQAE